MSSRKNRRTPFTPHMAEGKCADQGFPERRKAKQQRKTAGDLEARLMNIDKLKASLGLTKTEGEQA